jgi:hypothetical protein
LKLLPFDRFEIRTALAPQAAVARIGGAVEPAKWYRLPGRGDRKTFEGVVGEHQFEISHIIGYRNSFVPLMLGEVKPDGAGAIVSVKMRPFLFVIAFMVVWGAGVLFALLALADAWADGKASAAFLAIPAMMLVFAWSLVSGGFWFEAARSKKALLALL